MVRKNSPIREMQQTAMRQRAAFKQSHKRGQQVSDTPEGQELEATPHFRGPAEISTVSDNDMMASIMERLESEIVAATTADEILDAGTMSVKEEYFDRPLTITAVVFRRGAKGMFAILRSVTKDGEEVIFSESGQKVVSKLWGLDRKGLLPVKAKLINRISAAGNDVHDLVRP